MRRLLHRDDDPDRVDGQDLRTLDEPGSDDLLLLGLLRLLAKIYGAINHGGDERHPDPR